MNINEDGTVGIDLAALAVELKGAPNIGNDRQRDDTFRRIQIEALLDIAVSLRTVALDAAIAMGEIPSVSAEPEGREFPDDGIEAERDFLVVGDLVHIRDEATVFEVIEVGVDQDERWARINDEGVVKYWQRNLVRLTGDEGDQPDPLAEVVVAPDQFVGEGAHLAAPTTVAEGMADELDDEFQGDDFTAAESALERLKRLEKKPAKKAAIKKEKKA